MSLWRASPARRARHVMAFVSIDLVLIPSEVLYQLSYVGVCPANQPFWGAGRAAAPRPWPIGGPTVARGGVENWARGPSLLLPDRVLWASRKHQHPLNLSCPTLPCEL